MHISDLLEGVKRANYHADIGDNAIVVCDDNNGSIHWTCPMDGIIVFSRFGNYLAINSASSRKDEKRMLRKMGLVI